MKKPFLAAVLILLALAGLIVITASCYTLQETEQAIITEFGKPMGKPIQDAGLHFKSPFVQNVNTLDKRVMEWEGSANQVPTKDKLFIYADTYARWRIADPLLFFQSLHDEITAQSRLDDFLDGETRNAIANHALIEIIRTDTKREPVLDQTLISTGTQIVNWQPITIGREKVAHEIYQNAHKKLISLGIELIDIRFRRINYNHEVQQKIYDRMISERQQIANKFRSEGHGEAAMIAGEKDRELKRIQSEAYKKIQEIKGRADANATSIYAKAYNKSPEAYQFYVFQKTMETYQNTLDKSTTLILSTTGDFFKFMQKADQEPTTRTAPASSK